MLPERYTISTRSRVYTVVDDLLTTWQLLVAGRVVEDASGLPVPVYQVRVDHPDVYVKIASDGFFALAARVEKAFPDLATTAHILGLTVQAPRRQQAALTVNLPAGSSLPLPQLEIRLAFEPVRLQGRVVMALDGTAVGAALLRVDQNNLLTLRTPLHFDQPAATTVRACTFTPVGAALNLAQSAPFLSNRLLLSSSAGLAANHILRLGLEHQWEYVVVDGLGGLPNEVIVRGGLRRTYPTLTPVQQVSSALGAATSSLALQAQAGSSLPRLSGALAASHVTVQAANPDQVEYHTLNVLSSSQPADMGYFTLDGIQGQASLSIHAQNAANTHVADAVIQINPLKPVHRLNMHLSAL